MSNSSIADNSTSTGDVLYWVIGIDAGLISVYMIATIWFVITIAMYLKKVEGTSLSIKTLFTDFERKKKKKLIFLSGIFCILYLLLQYLYLLVPFLPNLTDYNLACEVVADIRFSMFILSQLMIYLYLWKRIRFIFIKKET